MFSFLTRSPAHSFLSRTPARCALLLALLLFALLELVSTSAPPSTLPGRHSKERDVNTGPIVRRAAAGRQGHTQQLQRGGGTRTLHTSAAEGGQTTSHVQLQQLDQLVDHFDAQLPLNRTFTQRYYVNDEHVRDWRSAPVFLYINGESAIDDWTVTGGLRSELAREHGALLLTLEHRFYGLSQPTGDLTTDSLRLLSSQQALADVAWFVDHITLKYRLSGANHWIVWGASYSGSLAAWFRIKYPHLSAGAVVSSAPVQAVLDFSAFHDEVTTALGNPLIGGSQQCVTSVKSAFVALDQMLATAAGRSQAAVMFNGCSTPASELDAGELGGRVSSLFDAAVQYDGNTDYGVADVCKIMLNTSYATPLDALAALQQAVNGDNCVDSSYADLIDWMSNTTVNERSRSRQYTYQTCTEFGSFQTCAYESQCVLSHTRRTLDRYLQMCHDLFGLPVDRAFYEQKVRAINLAYGGAAPAGSQTVYVNGDVDPWHVLSVLADRANNQTALLTKGTSHCYDIYNNDEYPNPPPAIVATRKQVTVLVAKYLAEAA